MTPESRMLLRRAYGSFRTAASPLTTVRWRVGRQEPCNVYACSSATEDYHDDFPVGAFKTPELAAEAVAAHNARLP
jgi:hypothetical protein